MATDLKSMTDKQLEKLQSDIAKELDQRATKNRDAALAAAEKAAKQHGFALSDLTGGPTRKSRRKTKAPPKYKNPNDASQTWSGRGRQPAWFKEAISKGKSPEDLAV